MIVLRTSHGRGRGRYSAGVEDDLWFPFLNHFQQLCGGVVHGITAIDRSLSSGNGPAMAHAPGPSRTPDGSLTRLLFGTPPDGHGHKSAKRNRRSRRRIKTDHVTIRMSAVIGHFDKVDLQT